jgi:hypothetical protein
MFEEVVAFLTSLLPREVQIGCLVLFVLALFSLWLMLG